jgi:arabinan endo-1,5-alpha-L-arabinosidase
VKHLTSITALLLGVTVSAFGLNGQPGVHDPSRIVECSGKYYCYGTGGGIPILASDDGWTWRNAGNVMSNLPGGKPGEETLKYAGGNAGTGAWAPDLVKIGDKYFLYYALSGQNHKAVIGLLVNRTLDPCSPDYKWEDGGPVAWSLGEGVDDLHAIDPGVLYDSGNHTLWLVYGSYYGNTRLAQLDPRTGKRLTGQPADDAVVANQSEAPTMICHEGVYYLITNKGTCCAGATSTYNIRVTRSVSPKGPFYDDQGVDMARGGGTLFAASGDRKIGPGHFGLLDLGDGVQKFSCHYEADLDQIGSVLDIRPLLWRDGWPVAGENVKQATYQVMSKRTGTVLELAVPGVPAMSGRGRGGMRGTPPAAAPTRGLRPAAMVAEASRNWPAGATEVRMAAYLLQAQQQWTITPVPEAGGYPGSPYFKFTVAGTDRTLTTTEDDELIAMPSFTGAPTQLWRIDQMADGSYRIAPKSTKDKLALTSIGRGAVTLAPFAVDNPNQRWLLNQP